MALVLIENNPKGKDEKPFVGSTRPIYGKKIAIRIAQLTGIHLPVVLREAI